MTMLLGCLAGHTPRTAPLRRFSIPEPARRRQVWIEILVSAHTWICCEDLCSVCISSRAHCPVGAGREIFRKRSVAGQTRATEGPDSTRFAARACLPLDLGSRPARRERYLKPIRASDGIVFATACYLCVRLPYGACLEFSMRAVSCWSCDRQQRGGCVSLHRSSVEDLSEPPIFVALCFQYTSTSGWRR